jgi:hypothetical protein
MGRKLRMVPADWQHPTQHTELGLRYVPLLGGSYAADVADWDEAARQWEAGFRENYGAGDKWVAKDADDQGSYAEYAGERPRAEEYMPDWPADQRTHFMMYEDTSEGTPISPALATPEELARWLADTGASSFGSMTATYDQWLATIKRGWACGMVLENGRLASGVEALADLPAPALPMSEGR